MKIAPAQTEALFPRTWTPADTALWCYLFLPVPIFLAGFFLPWIGLPLVAASIWGARHFLPSPIASRHHMPLGNLALLAILAAAWTAFGGAGHLLHANGVDWVPRFAVLRDLVTETWPPRYGSGAEAFVLRAPLAYYLPAATLGKAFGLAWIDALLLAWTWLGVALFFCANLAGSRQRVLTAAVIFAFASGLDVLGLYWRQGTLPWPTQHIEWWAGGMQYSSNTTLLFWVPNHGLPGWIAGAWLWRLRDDPRFLSGLPLLFLPIMFWSPLVAIGLLPLALVAALYKTQALLGATAHRGRLAIAFGLAGVPGALLAAYLLSGMFGAASEPHALTPTAPFLMHPQSPVEKLVFVFLEFGLFWALLLRHERSPLALASLGLLLALPWTLWGPNNDLMMRASIPALAILWMMLAEHLTAHVAKAGDKVVRMALLFLFAIGTVTPLLEFHRALAGNRWSADLHLSAPQALGGYAPHYFVAEGRNWLSPLMRGRD